MKQLFRLLFILFVSSCAENDIDLQSYHELRENNFIIPGKVIDLEEVMEESKLTGKPILFYFNSLACM